MKLRTKNEELIKNNPIQIVRNTTKHDAKWEEHFQKYSDLINQYGGPDKIPHSITIDEHLRSWIVLQPKGYFDKMPTMTQERIDKLNSIGFIWSP